MDIALDPPPRSRLNWPLLAGLLLVAAIVLPALVALVWTPFGATTATPLADPDAAHWLGTDPAGRDLVSLLMSSTLSSLLLAWFAILVVLLLALPAATFVALRLDHDGPELALLALPAPALAIGLVVSALGAPGNLTILLGIVLPGVVAAIPALSRAVRQLWECDYVTAARLAGLGTLAATQRHVLPRLLPRLCAIGLELLAVALLIELTLTFAGLGMSPPGASLGLMLRDGQQYLALRPMLAVAPGLVAVTAALALLLAATGLNGGRDGAR
jgi:peptide/nickel transport system permease protein